MQTDVSNDELMRLLAQEIALGGNVEEWARTRQVNPTLAREWTKLPEFREIVENCRVEHSERLAGKIARAAERAIERLVEFSEHAFNPSVALAATKAIIDKWIHISDFFIHERTYQSLNATAKALVAARRGKPVAWQALRT